MRSTERDAGPLAVRGLRFVASLVAGWLAVTAAAAQADPVVLKFGWTTVDSPNDPYGIGARAFAEALEEVAPGEFEVQFFPNRQLGDEKEMLEGLRFGLLDMAIITNAVIANIEPAFMVNDLPFLYRDEAEAHAVLDGPVGRELLDRLAEKNIVGLGFMEGGFRHMINNIRPVARPEDVGGVKFRVMQNPVYMELFSALGGNAVPMAWGEVYTAVQQGTIDGLEIPIPVIAAAKYFEITEYLSLTRHTYSAIGLLMAERTYDRLSEEQQAAVREAASRAVARQREQAGELQARTLDMLRENGMKVNVVENRSAFRERVKPVYEEFRSRIGDDIMDRVLAATE